MWKLACLLMGLQVYVSISGKVISRRTKLQYTALQGMAMTLAQGKENLSAARKPSLEFLQHYLQQLNMGFSIHLKGSLADWSDFAEHFV